MNETKLGIATYLKRHRDQLDLLEQMWSDPLVQCYNDADMPNPDERRLGGAIFLIGPTSRHQILEHNWRCQAVAHLRESGWTGFIYVPEPRGTEEDSDFTDRNFIHWWESNRLFDPETIPVAWIPRDANELLGLNTNWESAMLVGEILSQMNYDGGRYAPKKKFFIGWPPDAERMGLPNHYACERAGLKRYYTLRQLCFAVVDKIPPEDVTDLDDSIPF